MARWFWYLSPHKIEALKQPEKGWRFLRQRLRTVELEAGVPWAKLSTRASPDTTSVESVEKIEREIHRAHEVPPATAVAHGASPLFFEFEGEAGRLILRESYEGDEGDCVLVVAGVQENVGVLLLGAGSNVFGSASARPRFVNPSVDPVGSLLVLVERQATNGDPYTRAGIARDANGLSPEECICYSFGSAFQEIKGKSFTQKVRVLAVFTVMVPFHQARLPWTQLDIAVDRVIVGSPIYVEQLDSPS